MINDDDLGIIYLTNKKTDYMTLLYKNLNEERYSLGNDTILIRSLNNNDASFVLIDLSKKENETIDEIYINPSKTSILFNIKYLEKNETKIKVRYDNIEKNWDVRYIDNGKEVLSNLEESLNYLENKSFVKIIDSCKEIFELSKQKKLTK